MIAQHTWTWYITHTFIQQHGIYDVWMHIPSGVILVQDAISHHEMILDEALKHFFAKHTPAYDRLIAMRMMLSDG